MACQYRDQLIEARDKIGQQIQEAVACGNADKEFVKGLADQAKMIQELLVDITERDDVDKQVFDVSSAVYV